MAATGFFLDPRSSFLSPNVIYRQPPAPAPTSTARPPVNRMPAPGPTPTTSGLTVPTAVYPVNVDPVINSPQTVSTLGTGTSGGGNTAGATTTTGTTGAGTGGNLGGSGSTGTSDTSRVLDLIASLLKPQDIAQPLSPTIVPDTSTGPPGTNPMALVILAIAVIGGIFWFVNRKKRAA